MYYSCFPISKPSFAESTPGSTPNTTTVRTEFEQAAPVDNAVDKNQLKPETGTVWPVVDQSLLDSLRPPAPSPLFTGRTQDLAFLELFFCQETEQQLALVGESGSGKTQVALMFAEITRDRW